MTVPTYLYRLYGDADDLLYVGIAGNVESRFEQHSTRRWWAEVASARVFTLPTRTEALAAEAEAIKAELPKYNVTHVERRAGQPMGDALVGFTEADQERRRQRVASYALYPRHHIYDLLAQAGVLPKRWDVPQSYHSDAEWVASLDDYQRSRVEWVNSMSPQRLSHLLYP
jgi:excinuclease UvrABC nuclease subunit